MPPGLLPETCAELLRVPATQAAIKIAHDRPDVAVEVFLPETWPELLHVPATQAAMKIAHDRPNVAVEVFPPGSSFPPDFNPARVCVFIDNNGLVSQVPRVG